MAAAQTHLSAWQSIPEPLLKQVSTLIFLNIQHPMCTVLQLKMLTQIHQWLCCFFEQEIHVLTGFHRSWDAWYCFNQWEPVLDHYHSERTGTTYENQSTTTFNICTHGSETCKCLYQRVFCCAHHDHGRGFTTITTMALPSAHWQLRFCHKNKNKLKLLAPRVTVQNCSENYRIKI